MKRILILIISTIVVSSLFAQTEGVSINNNGTDPDPSAILDIQSTSKGMLIPRMDSTQRKAITNPANGLMVFDTDMEGFWFYNGNKWTELLSQLPNQIIDTDGDTRIMVEKTADEDQVRIEIRGNEAIRIDTLGNLGIGVSSPKEKLEINGAISIGNTDSLNEGSIRYSGSDFEGYNGDEWRSFTKSILSQTGHLEVGNDAILDAYNLVIVVGLMTDSNLWQSFTALSDSPLSRIEIKGNTLSSGNPTFQLFEGEGINGNLLLSGSVPKSSGWITVFDNESIKVEKGKKFTIQIKSNQTFGWEFNWSQYFDGRSNNINTSLDFLFRTYVNPGNVIFSFDSTNTSFSYGNDAIFIDKNSNVGIGTTDPDTSFHLVGKFKYEDGSQIEGAVLSSDSNGVASWNDDLILKNGNIGIGTNLPSRPLTIQGTTWNNNVNGGGDIKIVNSNNIAAGISIKSATTGGRNYSLTSTGPNATTGAGFFGIFDHVTFNYRLAINPDGNVGIGTVNPVVKLHVSGNTYISGNLGIGITNPTKAKVHISGGTNYTIVIITNEFVKEEIWLPLL